MVRGRRSCRHHNREGFYSVRKGFTQDDIMRLECKIMGKPPGYWCLVKMDRTPDEVSEKCEHTTGQWVVKWKGDFYLFDPATQLQKDIWLDNAGIRKEEAIKLLRWFCHECVNIQMP